jgi:hypothetical protein
MEKGDQQRRELLATQTDNDRCTIEEQRKMIDELEHEIDEHVKNFRTMGMLHKTSGRAGYKLCDTVFGVSIHDIRNFLLCEKRR